MTITADMIKELRQRSGAGIMECKDALKRNDGDAEAAFDFLRKKGSSAAEKKSGRSTKEGAVSGAVVNGAGALIEVKCETDFVARNEKFQELTGVLANHLVNAEFEEDEESFMGQQFTGDSSLTIKDLIAKKIQELGENIVIGRRSRFNINDSGGFGMYIHGVGGIGALVEVSCDSGDAAQGAAFKALCHDLAMQVAASHPISISPDDLSTEMIEKEKSIFEAQAKESGKPDKIIRKIVEGKLKKYYAEVCLLEQPYVKDTDKVIKEVLIDAGKELGAMVNVKRFARFQLGE